MPLNASGRVQAVEVARKLAGLGLDLADHAFLSSPLGRARETMEILRGTLGLDPAGYAVEPRLVELAFGRWEGMTWKEVRRRDPAAYARREQDRWSYVSPDGESYAGVAERVGSLLSGLAGPAVVVAHGGVARGFLWLRGGLSGAAAARVPIWQGRILLLRDGGHAWI